MNTVLTSFLIALVVAGCSSKDPIDVIVARDNRDGFFPSGFSSMIPASTNFTQIVSMALNGTDIVPAATNFTITATRNVQIHKNQYTAVMADTKLGRKVVLLRLEQDGTNQFWWNRVYDVQ